MRVGHKLPPTQERQFKQLNCSEQKGAGSPAVARIKPHGWQKPGEMAAKVRRSYNSVGGRMNSPVTSALGSEGISTGNLVCFVFRQKICVKRFGNCSTASTQTGHRYPSFCSEPEPHLLSTEACSIAFS